jgi:HSP20 family protein
MIGNKFEGGLAMNIVRWEPFREFDDFFRRFLPFTDHALSRRMGEEGVEWSPSANISETTKEYLIKAELPEVKKEDVNITMADGMLTLSGERKQSKEDKSENELRIESFYGVFSRSFLLPDDAAEKGVYAESKDGMLYVHIPKKESVKTKAVTIPVH